MNERSVMRRPRHRPSRTVRRVMLALTLCLATGLSGADDALYVGRAVVTGQDNPSERERGVRESLARVLATLSADPGIDATAEARRHIDAWLAVEDDRVSDISLVDRKADIQISDEQGTRERSFVLSVRFAPEPVHRLLDRLGARALIGERPPLGMILCVDYGDEAFVLSHDGEAGYAQRLALADVSAAFAVDIVLPDAVSVAHLSSRDTFAERAADVPSPTSHRLIGEMRAGPSGLWDTRWRLEGLDDAPSFSQEATTFDDAMHRAVAETLDALADAGIVETRPSR